MRSVRDDPEAYFEGELWWQPRGERPATWPAQTPARSIPVNRRSVTGRYPSDKMNRMVVFESTLERDLFERLEFDFRVQSYHEQPLCVSYERDDCRYTYIPDALVCFHPALDRPPLLVEVKYSADLAQHLEEYRPRFDAARGYAAQNGFEFSVYTDLHIRTPHLENARRLLPYRRITISDQIRSTLLSEMKKRRHTIQTLLLFAEKHVEKVIAKEAVFHLIAAGELIIDYETLLDEASSVERSDALP